VEPSGYVSDLSVFVWKKVFCGKKIVNKKDLIINLEVRLRPEL